MLLFRCHAAIQTLQCEYRGLDLNKVFAHCAMSGKGLNHCCAAVSSSVLSTDVSYFSRLELGLPHAIRRLHFFDRTNDACCFLHRSIPFPIKVRPCKTLHCRCRLPLFQPFLLEHRTIFPSPYKSLHFGDRLRDAFDKRISSCFFGTCFKFCHSDSCQHATTHPLNVLGRHVSVLDQGASSLP